MPLHDLPNTLETWNNPAAAAGSLSADILSTLPEELLLKIMKYLNPVFSACLGVTSRKFYRLHWEQNGQLKPLNGYCCDFNTRLSCGHIWKIVPHDEITPSDNIAFCDDIFGSHLVHVRDTDDPRFCWGWGQYYRVRNMLVVWMREKGFEWDAGIRKFVSRKDWD